MIDDPLAVRTVRSWRGIVAFAHPRTGGANDSHHRTPGIAGRTRRGGGRVAAAASERQAAMPVQQASRGHGSPGMAGFRQGLNEIGPTIVLLASWTCRSQIAHRNGRFDAQQTVENR